jgi:4-diphosphocytidyl-2-C-methyl-D-erythritol kinase
VSKPNPVGELPPASELPLRASAPAKINLGLFVAPRRERDSRHELATVIQAISLADELTLEWAGGEQAGGGEAGEGEAGGEEAGGGGGSDGEGSPAGPPRARGGANDEVLCPGLELDGAENLAAAALRLFRQTTGWTGPAVRLTIEKRIPVAAGLAGGSADAAATLRLARAASGLGSRELLLELAAELGADVPAQLEPGRWLATGAGERLTPLPPPGEELGVLLLPAASALSTGVVFAYGDELGIARSAGELAEIENELWEAFALGAATPAAGSLLHNDLQRAAVALRPEIEPALAQACEAGADVAFVSGSGPTVAGLFLGPEGSARARAAAATLAGRRPAALVARFLVARSPARDIPVRHNHGP